MRKILGIVAICAALCAGIAGCDSTTGPTKVQAVGTPSRATGGADPSSKSGAQSTMAPTPTPNPNYSGGVGTKIH